MRPTFQIQDNINGVILEGGTAANVIPALVRCEFNLRAETMIRIEFLIDLVNPALNGRIPDRSQGRGGCRTDLRGTLPE